MRVLIKTKSYLSSSYLKEAPCFAFTLLLFAIYSIPVQAQTSVWHANIRETNIDVRTAPVVLAEVTIDVPASGNVLVHFDGLGIPDVGDGLVVAASSVQSYVSNDGNAYFEIINGNVNKQSFSHTRMYEVVPGTHTFYAVAHNRGEQDGDGEASIYGSLTVKYFSFENSTGQAYHKGISQIRIDVRGNPVVFAEQTIRANEAGRVLVRFDGTCQSDVGDLILLAASDEPNWKTNDGNVACEAASSDVNFSPFSHSRMYEVEAGDHTFYAVAQNFVEQSGNGLAYINGSLTVEFYPNQPIGPYLLHAGIIEANIDIRTNTVTLAQLTLDAPLPGKAIVHFDGHGLPDLGDCLVLAASETTNWLSNEGSVNFKSISGSWNTSSFSHTRVYDIDFGGVYDFYAVANNAGEMGGDGEASIYGSLTVQYYPDMTRVSNEDLRAEVAKTTLQQNFPNPFSGATLIQFTLDEPAMTSLKIYDLLGKEVRTLLSGNTPSGMQQVAWDGLDASGQPVPNGVYVYRLTAGEQVLMRMTTLLQ